MRKNFIAAGGFVLFGTFHALAQPKPAEKYLHASIKSLHNQSTMLLYAKTLSLKKGAKSTAKTTTPLRLYALADYDISSSLAVLLDSTHYAYSGARGWGTDNPVTWDMADEFQLSDAGVVAQTTKVLQTFDAHDNVLTSISQTPDGSGWVNYSKTNFTYDTHSNVLSQYPIYGTYQADYGLSGIVL